jgi:hypothetical protein
MVSSPGSLEASLLGTFGPYQRTGLRLAREPLAV